MNLTLLQAQRTTCEQQLAQSQRIFAQARDAMNTAAMNIQRLEGAIAALNDLEASLVTPAKNGGPRRRPSVPEAPPTG